MALQSDYGVSMNLSALGELIRCPKCHLQNLDLRKQVFTCICGAVLPVNGSNILVAQDAHASADWREKQVDSISRYEKKTYNRDESIPLLFGGFISVGNERRDVILDIGCGITPGLPVYVRELGLENYIALEPLTKPISRSFPCFVGAVAEAIPLRDACVDAVVLATSMDHIEDIELAAKEMLRVLKPNGRLLVWVGLYEPEALARAKTFYPIAFASSWLMRIVRSVLLPVDYARLLLKIADRKRRLERGIPIDSAHCRYYTEERIRDALQSWGLRVSREVVVPGSASMFLEGIRQR